ncbi:MAG: hypothetical protein K2Q32_08575, partial [Alphaproteobacteria bacterium]|nr:hypothetical protein [Alphaproteobacteria bacterium]
FVKKQADATQMLIAKKSSDPACPATAEANTSCLNYCPATKAQCPLLYRDVYFLVWNGRAVDWQMYATNDLPQGRSIVPNPGFGNVLSIKLDERNSLCNDQEVMQNGGECVKYYQWDPNINYLRDIWRPIVPTAGSWPQEDKYNFTRWNHPAVINGKGEKVIDNAEVNGFAIKLKPGLNLAMNAAVGKEAMCKTTCPEDNKDETTGGAEICKEVTTHESVEDCHYEDGNGKQVVSLPAECTTDTGRQVVDLNPACDQKKICTTKIIDKTSMVCVPNTVTSGEVVRKDGACYKSCYQDFKYTCMDIKSNEAESYFIPNNTPEEFTSFYTHLPSKVKVSECERRYTPWQGNPTAVEFLRAKAKGTPLTTDVCALITDIPCDSSVVVSLTRGCEASLGIDIDCSQCNGDTRIDASDRNLSCSQTVTCFGAACPVTTSSSGGGDGGGGGGGDCVAGTVFVSIDKNKTVEASGLKVGDDILGFRSANPEHLFKTKVKEIKITHDVQLMSVNNVETNSIHVFLTQSRGPIAASDLKVSDMLIKSDNTTEVVKNVQRLDNKAPVYTIILEDADGYVANGYLVFSKNKDLPGNHKATPKVVK